MSEFSHRAATPSERPGVVLIVVLLLLMGALVVALC